MIRCDRFLFHYTDMKKDNGKEIVLPEALLYELYYRLRRDTLETRCMSVEIAVWIEYIR
jgi:hypothetical protein